MNRSRKIPLSMLIPMLLLCGLGLFMLVFVFLQASHYGLTMDEQLQDQYGRSILGWYRTLGKDRSFLNFPAGEYMPQHGAVFDGFVALIQRIVGHPWYTRAVVTGLAGVAGVIAIALCGYELGGLWGALLAALGLWLYPRYFGAIFTNPKDIPFAAGMTWVLWSTLLLVKHWAKGRKMYWYCVLTGFLIGFTASIRVTAVIWYAVLITLLVGWWIFYGPGAWREKKILPALVQQAVACGIIGLVSLLAMIVLWPYIFLNPIAHLYESIVVMQKYPWNGVVLFDGSWYPSTQLPRRYVPIWLAIGSPPTLVLFTLIGIVVACFVIFRKRLLEPQVAVVFLGFFVPFAILIIEHAAVYDTLRQFLFLIPPMILLAVYGGVQVYLYLIKHKQRVIALALVVLTVSSYALVVKDMIDLHPYEYTYFSPLVGGLPGAKDTYNTDYWGTCNKPAAEWLGQNYTRFTRSKTPTIEGVRYFEFQDTTYLPANFQIDAEHPDFFISYTRDHADRSFPTYRVIHTESIEGVLLCVVKVNPNIQK